MEKVSGAYKGGVEIKTAGQSELHKESISNSVVYSVGGVQQCAVTGFLDNTYIT